MPRIKQIISAQYRFNEQETNELAQKLAHSVQRKSNLEMDKKTAMSQFATEEKEIAKDIEVISQKIASGFEYRDFQCYVEHDFNAKVKRFIREEDGEVLEIKPLTASDWQMRIDIENEEKVTYLGNEPLPDPDSDFELEVEASTADY